MLELYHNDMSTCSQKARLALAEKGLKWTSHHLDLRAGDQQTPDYTKLNPNAVVPTLVDNGEVIIESTIINEYIDDAFPDPPLRPAGAHVRARMRLWTKQLDEGVHAATGVLSTSIAFRYQKLARSPEELDALINQMPDPAKRERNRQSIMKGIESPFFVDAIKRFDRLLADMELALNVGQWLAGDTFSLADIAYTPYMARLEHLKLHAMWDRRPHLADWFTRIKERPSYQTAIGDWLNPSYLVLMKDKGTEVQLHVRAIIEKGSPT